MAKIIKLETADNFNSLIKDNENVIVKFSAEWCGPCKTMGNMIKNYNDEVANDVSFAEIDVDEVDFADIITDYGIRNLPTFIFFKNGESKDRKVGILQNNEMTEWITNNK